ncbi:MAG: adenylate kinase [Dehalococcoidia bacterium]|nr:adenylate kinase [Dehalococcoidia bacterium]
MNLILLGPPGAGKGTQAINLAKKLGAAHIATGDMFRQAIANGTPIGKKAKEYMDKGVLVPDEVTIQMLLERLGQPDSKNGFILDGFPRNISQAEALDKALSDRNSTIDAALLIDVKDSELIGRLTGRWVCRTCQTPYNVKSPQPKVQGKCDRCGGELYQREDDKEAVIENRLKVYREQSLPLIEYYSKRGRLKRVSGEQAIGNVEKDLLEASKATAGRVK